MTTHYTFRIRKWEDSGNCWGEAYCPYDAPENKLCDDLQDGMEKSQFAFEGSDVEQTGEDTFTSDGDEYRVVLEDTTDAE